MATPQLQLEQEAGAPASLVRLRPLLRGWSHALAAAAALPAAWVLVSRAGSPTGTWGAGVYGASLALLFLTSALYHRVYWPSSVRHLIGRIDHSAIFLLIAGTYTPFCLLLGPGTGHRLLALVWIAAALGIGVVVGWKQVPKPLRAGLYVLLGWFIVPVIPALHAAVGDRALGLLLVGGAFYTVGAVIYATRRPDPFPRVFGFHEIFHLLVIAAAICHFLVVDAAVRAMG
jgi:hemolysin III